MNLMQPAVDQQTFSCSTGSRSLFRAPYDTWTLEQLFRHFQTRRSVHYFPVVDAVETAREKIDNILNNQFELNQESHTVPSPIQWTVNPSHDREWLISLHKFYYAVGLGMAYHETRALDYAEKWVDLTKSWIQSVPLDFLPSDVAGRRIQNWIFAQYYFMSTTLPSCVTPDFYRSFLESLHQQVSYLRDHVTPARNHRTLELCAIFLASVVFPEFADAAEWLNFSRAELANNIQADLLPDGVHFEQSTDYHHLVLKNYLWIRKLALLNQIDMPGEFDALVKKALEFSLYCHRPDGMIPALSDGDSRCFLDLLQQGYELYGAHDLLYVASRGEKGHPPTERSKGFHYGGYYIFRSGWGDQDDAFEDGRYLIFDCGPLGAGDHGHLDVLSFEAMAYGKPLIVDPGRYTYDQSGTVNWRALFRGTACHNTVLVDKKNQTRYEWRKTRFKIAGPEPERTLAAFVSQPGLDYVHGIARSHEYPVIHERKILFVNGEYWVIVDLLRAEESHRYDLLFHLAPPAQGAVSFSESPDTLSIHSPHLLLAQPLAPTVLPSIEEGFISTTYGKKDPAPIVQLTQHASNTCFLTVVYPYKSERPTLSIDAPQINGLLELQERHQATMSISIAHKNGNQYRDELAFIDQSICDDDALVPSHSSHVRVARTGSDGRPLFQYHA